MNEPQASNPEAHNADPGGAPDAADAASASDDAEPGVVTDAAMVEGAGAGELEPLLAAPESAPLGAEPIGTRLAQAREALGFTVEGVAAQLKVNARKIAMLERDEWQALPEGPYLRGLIRGYAKVVGVDSVPLLAALDVQLGRVPSSAPLSLTPSLSTPFPERSAAAHDSNLARLMSLGVPLFAVIALLVWWSGTGSFRTALATIDSAWPRAAPAALRDQATPAKSVAAPGATEHLSPADASDVPEGSTREVLNNRLSDAPAAHVATEVPAVSSHEAALAGPAPAAAAIVPSVPARSAPTEHAAPGAAAVTVANRPDAASAPLVMKFRDDAWVEVREAHGRIVVSQLNRAGAEKAIDAAPPLDLVIGNAPAVTLTYRGTVLDLAPYTRERVAHVTLK